MHNYEERTIHVPGFTLALKIWHPEKPNPILCLHGKLDNAASFDLLAPLIPHRQLVAVDYPGTGFSSHYPPGVMPHWKNDALLMLHLIKALEWEYFDIIAHSLGSLLATTIAIAQPERVGKLIFLDILGPTVNLIEQATINLPRDVATYLSYNQDQRTLFDDRIAAIHDRMKIGPISYQAAESLVSRGTVKRKDGWQWTFDKRLRCVGFTLPYEDEIRAMFRTLDPPICLIRAKQGVPYPENFFHERMQSIKNVTLHEVQGGHHVHMDSPELIADISIHFLNN
ncbi:alpha/beta hydrolase [Legionella anisa]|uniref:Alpha/beta hydrolase n=1 Tax=Legionella anisa TaxID=28082 RepID=A0AAX0WZT9_9GAMM|nr:alpha/beta hydrolase [Legionella anisa]AWN73641.1 alpha/beta hydrolase [Legionella anisa]KTC75757.1 lipase A [Legionella anisa]MCW8426534.1 alpha/beta hydrolase [Legionella anisa]MCW8448197.1 alpha/beta hydrolase [Legionella anisa]PNL62449.1 alpha/beta hydrolase [Legionella anisa]